MLIKPLDQCSILVTPTSFAKYNKDYIYILENAVKKVIYNTIGRPLQENELLPLVAGIDGFIAGLDDITSRVIKAAGNLKVISRYGTGVDRVDLKAASKSGIFVTNTPGANSVSVAELAIGLAISAARNIPEGNAKTKNGSWPRFSGTSLSGKTFGIIGLGSVGKEVAKRLLSFNVKILAYDINFDAVFASKYNVLYSDTDSIFKSSDFISLHIPVFKDTLNIINKNSLSKMKHGAILINTARGELVDEDALYESLKSGHLRAAALDAFKEEPPNPKNKLLNLPQVTAVPHMGAATDDASNEMTRISIEECFAVLKGEIPKYAVTGPGL
jgi:D-3-phosphoglycerate dehydrogenase / 2-oxoglutarate reductase